jgi:hypothetical protein
MLHLRRQAQFSRHVQMTADRHHDRADEILGLGNLGKQSGAKHDTTWDHSKHGRPGNHRFY